MNASKTTSILVTGASGQLGSRLEKLAGSMPDVTLVGLTQQDLDVCDEKAVFAALEEHRPNVVIHAAAYTAVDRAENPKKKRLAWSMETQWAGWRTLANRWVPP